MSDFMKTLCRYYMRYLDTDFKEQGMPQRRYLKNNTDENIHNLDLDEHPYRNKILRSLQQNLKEFPTDFGEELLPLSYTKDASGELEFYLNIGEILYKGERYPIFYINLSVDRDGVKKFAVEPSLQFYFHTKLLEGLMSQMKHPHLNVPDRMRHVSEFEEGQIKEYIDEIMRSICDAFDLEPISLFEPKIMLIENETILIRNSLEVSLFHKSDDSVINDYEGLLRKFSQEDCEEFSIFKGLSESFIYKNPVSFNSSISNDYDKKSVSDRFSYKSPIPLNKEQQQILMAVRNESGCDRIVIEGPPGTGKSHTIAAIIYDALLRGKTVLVTSDKKEALDVVEEKMNQVLKSIETSVEVYNPILRLDSKKSNLSRIFEKSNSTKITERMKVFNQSWETIENEADDRQKSIEAKLRKEKEIRRKLTQPSFLAVRKFDAVFEEKFAPHLDTEEMINNVEMIREIYSLVHELESLREYSALSKNEVELLIEKIPESLLLGKEIQKDNLGYLFSFVEQSSRLGLLSVIFKRHHRKALEEEFQDKFLFSKIESPLKVSRQLKAEHDFYKVLPRIEAVDMFQIMRKEDIFSYLQRAQDYYLKKEKYKEMAMKIPITSEKFDKMEKHPLLSVSKEEVDGLTLYLKNLKENEKCYLELADLDIKDDRKIMENRLVMQLTNILDTRLIEFLESHRNDASELKKIIKGKSQLRKGHVELLLKAMPILIVGIRDLGNYLPLEKNLFDLLIIDEASQVSIAQAFPAIIRAKKAVVLGDPKQFDNVKSHNANKIANDQAFSSVKESFAKELKHIALHEQELKMSKVEQFNIKINILRFMEGIANYHTILTKHFRGYIELISYSNEFIYDKSLQVMKIRGIPRQEVIQFFQVGSQPWKKGKEKTNHEEAVFILEQIRTLKEEGYKGSVGILSPTTEQVSYIKRLIDADVDVSYFRNMFNLKEFTFDSCQGEEMDIVFYSLVEREGQNFLSRIFMIDETRFHEGEDAPQHLKRLNVGLSRAKESIRFVTSKPIENFKGNMRNALIHFRNQLEMPDYINLFDMTDDRSPMENLALNCILQTDLVTNNKGKVEIIPQFPVGKYIKQLDPYAPDRNFVSDFLVMMGDRKVIIEYDGFKEHFKSDVAVSSQNYQDHYLDQDIERQRTIESYGYPFIRLNKFHMRSNPIQYLNESLAKYFDKRECL